MPQEEKVTSRFNVLDFRGHLLFLYFTFSETREENTRNVVDCEKQ